MKNKAATLPVLFGRADIFAYILVILAAFLLVFSGNGQAEPQKAVVVCGDTAKEYSLSENNTFDIENNGITLTVVIENGSVYVKSSDCHDGICKDTGKITKSGQVIVCAPAMVAIRIEGEKEDGYDAVIR